MAYNIAVGSYTNDIVTLSFNSENASLKATSSFSVGHHPSWLAANPSHPSLVWTGLEQADGKVLTLRFDSNGKGEVVSETSSGGKDPCHLFALKDELIIGNVCAVLLID
jgi:6-phosphogluconolactonase (cycloisomerase 2 family)